MSEPYAHPEVLVSADWVQEHLNDPRVRIVESDEDLLLYDLEHIPGAIRIDWQGDLQDQIIRDYINAEKFADLCSRSGIANDTTVVFYGDKSNWWACYAFWTFTLFGHKDCRVMMAHLKARKPMIDVRSPKEFTGELLHMEDYPQEGSLRGGHIPGAKNVPWARAVNEDGTFKSAEELKAIYQGEVGLAPTDDVVAYCRIGERSSLTWFVLTYLLGYSRVRNYDGSWTEWGNLVRVPVAKGA
jgi:thiosulfate/3-mercaptopyruvate sulfurtransferase